MPELFKFIEEKEVDKEWRWTYLIQFEFIFNKLEINYLTITDHPWKKKGRTMITKELILEILAKMNGGNFGTNGIWWCSGALWVRNYSWF